MHPVQQSLEIPLQPGNMVNKKRPVHFRLGEVIKSIDLLIIYRVITAGARSGQEKPRSV